MTDDYFSYTHKLFDNGKPGNKPEALSGIRVLDLARVIFGPVVSKWLALFGAEVIKVEEPYEGDEWRLGTYWAKYWKGACPYFHTLNYNKYFVAIDLKEEEGKKLVLELAKICDVVVENFRAGLSEAWGIGYTTISQVNPKIIYVSCSGYGQWGPLRFFPSWDLIAQSMSGVARLTGFPGRETYKLQDYYGDFFPGLCAVVGVLAALNYRERTGKGQYIDMAQAEALMRAMLNWVYISVSGKDLGPTGNIDPTMAPSGIFRTRDGKFVAIAIGTDEQFRGLAEAMGKPELLEKQDFAQSLDRLHATRRVELDNMVQEWVSGKTEAEVIEASMKHGFPTGKVMDDWKLVNDEWRRERGSVIQFQDDMYGKDTWPGAPVALSRTPARLKQLSRPIGYHNRYVLRKLLNLPREEIERLEKKGVIGYWANRVGQCPPSYYQIDNDPIFTFEDGEE